MTYYESTADLNEQVYYERLDADMLMAQYEAESAATAARYARGICGHNSHLGRKVPAFYSAEDIAEMLATNGRFQNRGGFAGGQEDIPEGQLLCTECGELIEDRWA